MTGRYRVGQSRIGCGYGVDRHMKERGGDRGKDEGGILSVVLMGGKESVMMVTRLYHGGLRPSMKQLVLSIKGVGDFW